MAQIATTGILELLPNPSSLMSSHAEKLSAVRAKIVEAVPEIINPMNDWCSCSISTVLYTGRPITLEDVLRTLDKTKWKHESGVYLDVLDFWELGQPLHLQSEGCISFLHSLLIDG
jgi:hypothetical protein